VGHPQNLRDGKQIAPRKIFGSRHQLNGKTPGTAKRKADPSVDFVNARKLLIRHSDWRMTFARRTVLFALDNLRTWLLVRIGTAGGVEAGGGVQGAPIANFAFDGAGVRRISRRRGYAGVKITVGALGLAERHLDINSERLWLTSSHYGLSHRLESDQHGRGSHAVVFQKC
jgi:hypothetical protein